MDSTPARRQRIVVGIDGSDTAANALDWAMAEAAVRQASLEVVHAWSTPYAYAPMGVGTMPIDPATYERDAKELLADEVDRALERAAVQPPEVHRVLSEGPAAATLLHAAAGADLLVVGTRGRGGVTEMVLGSVSRQCTHHAPCPVVVVPPAVRANRRP